MENRVNELKKSSNARTATANNFNARTLQDIHDDAITTGFSK